MVSCFNRPLPNPMWTQTLVVIWCRFNDDTMWSLVIVGQWQNIHQRLQSGAHEPLRAIWYSTLDIFRSNKTRHWTQHKKKKVKTLFKLWTQKILPIYRPYGWAIGRLFLVIWRKETPRYRDCTILRTQWSSQSLPHVCHVSLDSSGLSIGVPEISRVTLGGMLLTFNMCSYICWYMHA